MRELIGDKGREILTSILVGLVMVFGSTVGVFTFLMPGESAGAVDTGAQYRLNGVSHTGTPRLKISLEGMTGVLEVGKQNWEDYCVGKQPGNGGTFECYFEKKPTGIQICNNGGNKCETDTAVIIVCDAAGNCVPIEARNYSVKYDWGAVAPGGATLPSIEQARAGDVVSVAAVRAVSGWVFDGWYYNGSKVSTSTIIMPNDDVMFTGSWSMRTHDPALVEQPKFDTTYQGAGENTPADQLDKDAYAEATKLEGYKVSYTDVAGKAGDVTWNEETEEYVYGPATDNVRTVTYVAVEKPVTNPEGGSMAYGTETRYFVDGVRVENDPTGESVRFVDESIVLEGVDGSYTWNDETEEWDYTSAVSEIVHRYFEVIEVITPQVITPNVPPVTPVVEEPIVEEPIAEVDDEEDIVTNPEEKEEDNEVLGETDGGEQWALLNLLSTIVTGLISLVMIIAYFGGDEGDDEKVKRHGLLRALTLVPLAGAVIAFILTEDMSNPMQMVDSWTILMVAIVAVQIVLAVLARKTTKKNRR